MLWLEQPVRFLVKNPQIDDLKRLPHKGSRSNDFFIQINLQNDKIKKTFPGI